VLFLRTVTSGSGLGQISTVPEEAINIFLEVNHEVCRENFKEFKLKRNQCELVERAEATLPRGGLTF
jgi:hypothetical protein